LPNHTVLADWPTRRLVLVCIATYLGLHMALRLTFGQTLEMDEAEQVLLGQWLLPGYDGQPPLYTWLQYGLFSLFGRSLTTLSLFKNLLQLLTYLLIFLGARKLCGRESLAALATISMLMIPQFAWESQRDLTHTPLSVTLAAATLYAYLVAVDRRKLVDYVILGIVLGLGPLTKHNYSLFAGCLVVTGLTTPAGRQLFLDRRVAVTAFLAVAVSSIYFSWFIGNPDLATSSAHKLSAPIEWGRTAGLKDVVLSAFTYLTPLWIALLLFPRAYVQLGRSLIRGRGPYHVERFLPVLFAVLTIAVLFFGLTHYKDRWMQPVLFLFPALFFAGLPPDTDPRRVRWFTYAALSVGALFILAMFAHVIAGDVLGKHPSRNFPFTAIAEQIRTGGFERGLIVGDSAWVAGNLELLLPESDALAPGFIVPREKLGRFHDGIILAWDTEKRREPHPQFLEFVRERLGLVVNLSEARYLTGRYQHSDAVEGTIGVLYLPVETLPAPGAPSTP